MALLFGNSSLNQNDQLQNVLFEFEIDVRQQSSNPFANISSISHFPEESEILFMIGCKFEVQDSYFDEKENHWLIKLDLDYAYNPQQYRIYEYISDITIRRMLKYCISEAANSISRASVHDMNIIFHELTDLHPTEEKWILAIKLYCLGLRNYATSRYHAEAITYFKQALLIWNDYMEDNELNYLINIGEIHKIMSVCYESRRPVDKNLAMTHSDFAIFYIRSAIEKTHTDYEKIDTMNRLANAYGSKMHISNNIKENAPMIIKYLESVIEEMLKYYSKNDTMIISRITRLAECFVSIHKYDEALEYYENMLNIYLQQPKLLFNWITRISQNMADVYMKYKYDFNSALRYQLLNHEYTLKSQVLHRTDSINGINIKKDQIAWSYDRLAVIYIKLGQYSLANTSLMMAMKLHEDIHQSSIVRNTIRKIVSIKIKLADISVISHQYDMASEHLENAMRLCEGRSTHYDQKIEIADIYMKLANGYAKVQQNDLAYEYIATALSIYRETNDSQYESKTTVTTVVNGRIRRRKKSSTIIYVTKYDGTRSYIIAFLDRKITTVTRSAFYKELRRICNRRK